MEVRRFSVGLVVCLLISNLAVGSLSLVFLQKVNQRYAELFAQSVPVVNDLRALTRELSLVQRLARRSVDRTNEPAGKDLLPQMAEASARVRTLADAISQAAPFSRTGHAANIASGGQLYEARVREYLALAQAGRLAEANQFNIDLLRPAYDDFQDRVAEAAEFVERHASELREQYARDSRLFGGLLLVLGGWPLLAGGLFVVVLALIVTSLLITVFLPKFDLTRRLFRSGNDR